MRRLFLITIMTLITVCGFSQSNTTVNNLKDQQKVLDLTAKLNKMQLAYEKKKLECDALSNKAAGINADANTATTDFNAGDPASTVKDAKDTVKKLEATKDVNKKLAKSQKELSKMEKKIAKLQDKLDQLNKKVEIINK